MKTSAHEMKAADPGHGESSVYSEATLDTATRHVEPSTIPTEIRETAREFVVQFDLPDVARDSLRVHWVRHTLQIEGHRTAKCAEGRVLLDERPSGHFQRAVPLPAGALPQGIRASYTDGVLTVRVPKDGAC